MERRLWITNDYKYYDKSYQGGTYIGVQNWSALRATVAYGSVSTQQLNDETNKQYGFIFGTEEELIQAIRREVR